MTGDSIQVPPDAPPAGVACRPCGPSTGRDVPNDSHRTAGDESSAAPATSPAFHASYSRRTTLSGSRAAGLAWIRPTRSQAQCRSGERRAPRLQCRLGIGRGQTASLVFRCLCGGSRREGE